MENHPELLVKLALRPYGKLHHESFYQIDSVVKLDELKVPPGNRLEPLSGNRKGQYSIRINKQFRICFKWGKSGPDQVEITDYY